MKIQKRSSRRPHRDGSGLRPSPYAQWQILDWFTFGISCSTAAKQLADAPDLFRLR
jgi:hypothetical protein